MYIMPPLQKPRGTEAQSEEIGSSFTNSDIPQMDITFAIMILKHLEGVTHSIRMREFIIALKRLVC